MSRAKGPPSDPYRKARFREEARDIVAKDRWERKYGRAVDTGGAIARALERAYKQGFSDAQGDPRPAFTAIPANGPLDWALIPPRPRNAFWSCCLYMYGRKGDRERPGWLEPAPTSRGTMGWRLVVDGTNPEKVIGNNSIGPLVDLDLIERVPGTQDHMTISARGRATWERFLAEGGQYPDDLPPF
ncbi:hypothetical protein [Aurantimonas sp. VKM B-3413]|uniref:hypothetical protein n=1 Tax=Aurantimonas sp. VKM B-3413 TaxID=2779401 RepID=UPI001E4E7D4E|nr:hypothetical protein [Aurantimonas sp. VKM B-3413]MCB8835850.1 hypothetical protein [Aurantimonas sp. VKM B-3413]